jgi:hypothetical protein
MTAATSTAIPTQQPVYLPVIRKDRTPTPTPTGTPTSTVTPAPCLTVETEPNNTANDADYNDPFCPDREIEGKLPLGDDYDIYRIEVAQAGTLVADLREIPQGTDYDLLVYNADRQKIAESRKNGTASEHIEVDIQKGKYYLMVYPFAGRSEQSYRLRWSLLVERKR